MDPQKRDDAAESRRILKGVTDASAHGFLMRSAEGLRDHAQAKDADQADWIEVWGTRIGRTVGVAVLLAIAVWLLVGMMNG